MGHILIGLPNTNNKWVEFELVNVDTFIIRVGFGLANVDTIRTLTRHEHNPWTRIATPSLICLLYKFVILYWYDVIRTTTTSRSSSVIYRSLARASVLASSGFLFEAWTFQFL